MTGRISDHECQPIIGQGNRIPPISGENTLGSGRDSGHLTPRYRPLHRRPHQRLHGGNQRRILHESIACSGRLIDFCDQGPAEILRISRHCLKFRWSDRLDRVSVGYANRTVQVTSDGAQGFDDPLIQRHRRVGNEEGDNRRENEEPYAELSAERRHRCASSIALVFHFVPQVNGGGDHGVVGAPCLGFVGGTGGSRRSTFVHGVEGRGCVVVQPHLLRGAHPGELTEQGWVAIEGCFERANERVCLRNGGLVGNEGSFPPGKDVVAEVT